MADQDVLIGPGKLYRAPTGTANPDETTVAYGAAWGGSWTDMGDFPEGNPITIGMAETVAKVYGQQTTAPKKQSRTRRELIVKGALLELSAANVAIAVDGAVSTTAAGAAQKGYSEVAIGVQADITEYKWGVEALRVDSAGSNQPIRWFFNRGSMKLSGDLAHDKTKESMIPFEISIFEDTTAAAGEELGVYQVVTAAATTT
jgi:hypothetical protein